MVKYLNHSLAVHPLFHKACYVRYSHLLAHKIFSAVSSDLSGYEKHDNNDQYSQHRKSRA